MADFPGVNYRAGLIGDGFSELDNTSHVDSDVLRRRPGYQRRVAVEALTSSPFSRQMAVQATDGTMRLVDLSADTVSASKATTGTTPGTFVRYNGRLYWSNGSTGPFVLDDTTSTARTPGITAPTTTIEFPTITTTTPGNGMTAGVHLFRYRYKNAATGYLSNPSGAAAITMTTDGFLQFIIGAVGGSTDIVRPSGTWADRIVIEATVASGAAFYACYDVAASDGSVQFLLNDIKISAKTPALVYGDDGHNPMPQFDLIVEHRSRLYGIQASTRLLGWSRPGYPESWDITVYSRKLSQMEAGDEIAGAASFMGDLYIFNRYGISRFTYSDDPNGGTVLSIPTDHGLWNQRCLVAVNNVLYGFGPGGIWQIRAMNPEHLSRDIDPFIEDTMDTTQYAEAFGWYNQEDRSISWAFTPIGGTLPIRCVTYAVGTGKWSTRTYTHLLRGASYAYQQNYLFANGYMWRERRTWLDGVATVITATASASSSGTMVTTVESMGDYIGGHLTYGTETRLITNFGTNSLTLNAALVIPQGGVAFIGAVRVAVESDWLADNGLAEVTNPVAVFVEFEPSESTRSFRFSVYQDFATAPVIWYRDVADTAPDGVTFNDGDNAVRVAFDGGSGKGFVPVPMPSQYARCAKLRLVADEPTSIFGLISMRLASREATQSAPGTGE